MMRGISLAIASFALVSCTHQCDVELSVDLNNCVADVQPTMWGVFFEDINMAADGGIYAELVKNRSFEFDNPTMGWIVDLRPNENSFFGIVNDATKHPDNPRYAQIRIEKEGESVSLINAGFRGMGLKEGMSYDFSILVRNLSDNPFKSVLTLYDAYGDSVGGGVLEIPVCGEWTTFSTILKSTQTCEKGSLKIEFKGVGELNVDMLSLFPEDTWKNRKGGLRADLVQLLYELKPGFLRFPGGCIVEGRDLSLRYQWKKTVGPIEGRKSIINRWNTEFMHRHTPDYYQSFGLGFFEYFQLAEDLGAEPLPILSCGMACQYNTGELVPLSGLDEYVQDAVDLVEFANGDTTTVWGKIRCQMGHPAPFNLKMIGVGNEQWGPQYFERYAVFEKELRAKCPDILIVSGSGPSAEGHDFDYAWDVLKNKYDADIVDEHYYKSSDWFLQNANRYDLYDRNGPKVFAGEYAAQSVYTGSPENRNTWKCALAEAAFMTGLERNADVVHLASYAPLFAHVEGWQWTPDLIWFDNLRSCGSANYQVQKLYSTNRGHKVFPVTLDGKILNGEKGIYASAVVDTVAGQLILKMVNASSNEVRASIDMKGGNIDWSKAEQTVLTAKENDVNTLDNPNVVSPVSCQLTSPIVAMPPLSMSVIKVKL